MAKFIHCDNCGNNVSPSYRNCPYCNADLRRAQAPASLFDLAKGKKRPTLVDNWGGGFSKYTLVSTYTQESFSADPGDYWNVDPNHVFKDSEGFDMSLAEMAYDMTGSYHVKRIVKSPVMVKDLPQKVRGSTTNLRKAI